MTPALDPKQGSFLKRGKYSGSWGEADSPEKPKIEKSKFALNKLAKTKIIFSDFALYWSWEAVRSFKVMLQGVGTFFTIENFILRTFFFFSVQMAC